MKCTMAYSTTGPAQNKCDHLSTRIGILNRKMHENYERFVLTQETWVIYKHENMSPKRIEVRVKGTFYTA